MELSDKQQPSRGFEHAFGPTRLFYPAMPQNRAWADYGESKRGVGIL